MPSLLCKAGDVVFVRATVIEACADYFKLRIEDYPRLALTVWAPVSEIAKFEHLADLRAPRFRKSPLITGDGTLPSR